MAAGAPHAAPFMADECLLAMPEIDSLDYTMKEYMRYVDYVKVCVDRLNTLGILKNFGFCKKKLHSTLKLRLKKLISVLTESQLFWPKVQCKK